MAQFTLPQQDSYDRKKDLETLRTQYLYSFEYVAPIGMQFYNRDKASSEWVIKLLKILFRIRSNLEHILKETKWTFTKQIPKKSSFALAKDFIRKDFKALLSYYNPDLGPKTPNGRPQSKGDYDSIFLQIPRLSIIQDYLSDVSFARSFVAGANPIMLTRMTEHLPNFPFTQEVFSNVPGFGKDNLDKAMKDGRIYFVDYKVMGTLVSGAQQPPNPSKFTFAPIVVFGLPINGKEILPLAIQCGQTQNNRPLFVPTDGWSWTIAKSVVNVAHYSYHEMVAHLAFTHLLVEPIIIATRRQLHERHPVNALLNPHFEGTMPINALAVTKLIQSGQAVDRLVGSQKQSNYDLLASQRLKYSFKGNYPPARFKKLGTDDVKALPNYPYRDDALLIWNAVSEWTTAYVDFFYKTDADVKADNELQDWAAEISSDKAGSIKDFGSNGRINDKAELSGILAMIIFTAGPQHAALNFPQATAMAFVPAAPMAGYTDEPRSKNLTEKDWLNFLPPIDVALVQLHTGTLLGSIYHTTLGHYPSHLGRIFYFTDYPIRTALSTFQNRLVEIEAEIKEKNKSRIPYEFLLPSKIPQSVNV